MNVFNRIIDFVIPPRCIVTGDIVDRQGVLSATAWKDLNFIAAPHCVRCGLPFEFVEEYNHKTDVCGACLKKPPIYNQARAALVYDDASRDIILGFKHGDQTQSVPCFVPWLGQAGVDFLDKADLLIPVPLHRWRILRRRFNQSALLVTHLSHDTKIPFILKGLERIRSTPTQGHLQSNERQKNVKNAFAVPEAVMADISGKHIVLVDDVFTTGATVNECAKILLEKGAGTVDVLTLARVVKPTRF